MQLTPTQSAQVVQLLSAGVAQDQIARHFGITESEISLLANSQEVQMAVTAQVSTGISLDQKADSLQHKVLDKLLDTVQFLPRKELVKLLATVSSVKRRGDVLAENALKQAQSPFIQIELPARLVNLITDQSNKVIGASSTTFIPATREQLVRQFANENPTAPVIESRLLGDETKERTTVASIPANNTAQANSGAEPSAPIELEKELAELING